MICLIAVFIHAKDVEKQLNATQEELKSVKFSEKMIKVELSACEIRLESEKLISQEWSGIQEILDLQKPISERNWTKRYDCSLFAWDTKLLLEKNNITTMRVLGWMDGITWMDFNTGETHTDRIKHEWNEICLPFEPQDNRFVIGDESYQKIKYIV
ncbi:hypothetical protein HQ529_03485 [Candidatus Woesearchaeota archaeon]|nr:hypothetical protein [Candidatus Woesearchaeota archaeon]